MIKELVYKNRSYRRFYESEEVGRDALVELVDYARVAASGRNLQPLKYFISNDKSLNAEIFSTLAWAGYLKDWDGPSEGERPSAYIVIVEDKSLGTGMIHDQGIAAENILLGAVEKDLGGCIIASIKKAELSQILKLSDNLSIVLVIALGKPKEEIVLTDVEDGNIKYWRDENQVHYVPKRSLKDILINY